jgi:hypothetical protein
MKRPSRHRVAVVRAELREASSGDMVIRLLEVRQGRHEDITLGVVHEPSEACAVLSRWLAGLRDEASDDRVTLDRRAGGGADGSLAEVEHEGEP